MIRPLTTTEQARRPLVAIAFVFVYLYAFPYFAKLRSANEVPRVFLTEEMVEHGTFELDARWSELTLGSTFDVATTPDGHRYSNKAPGASFVAVPAYLLLKAWHAVRGGAPTLGEATWAFRVSSSTLPMLLFLPVFVRVSRRFAPSAAPRRAALVGFALGSMVLPYALLFYSHDLAAACAGGAFAGAVALRHEEAPRPRLTAVGVGLLLGGAVLADYQSVLAAALVGGYLLVTSPRRMRDVGLAALGSLAPLALLLLYHHACFGAPWRTGYAFAVDPAHKLGLLGIVGPSRQALWQALLAPDNGLVTLTPWVLVALGGAAVILGRPEARRRVGAEAGICLAVALGYLLFVGSLVPEFGRAGWSVGPRYIVVAMPFLGWLLAAGLEAVDPRPAGRALAHALVLVGVIVFVVAATTYPHWPIAFENPLFEVSFRALGAGLAPHSLGTALGLTGLASLAPLYLVVAGLAALLVTNGERARAWPALVAAALAALIVVGYGHLPTTPAPPAKWQYVESTWEPR